MKIELSYLDFTSYTMGRYLENLITGQIYQKWEAYHLTKDFFLYVAQGNSNEFAFKWKEGWDEERVKEMIRPLYLDN